MDRSPREPPSLKARFRRGLRRGGHACWILFRVTIPTFIVMDLLERLGVIRVIGHTCAPIMSVFRLPGEAAIPVLLGLSVNVFTAAAALGSLELSGGQVTTLALMIGLAHALVVETAVLRSAKARASSLLLYRVLMSLAVGLAASRILTGTAP